MEKYTDAVFDLDHTLIDSGGKLQTDVVEAFAKLGKTITPEEIGKNWYQTAARYGIGKEAFDKVFDERKTWEQALRDGDVPIFPETHSVLSSLHEQGIRLSLISRSIPEYTQTKLDYFKLSPYFAEVLTVKPDSDSKKQGALELIRRLGPETIERAYFIGDKKEDVTLAEDVREKYGIPSNGIYVNRQRKSLPGFTSVNSLEKILGVIQNGR